MYVIVCETSGSFFGHVGGESGFAIIEGNSNNRNHACGLCNEPTFSLTSKLVWVFPVRCEREGPFNMGGLRACTGVTVVMNHFVTDLTLYKPSYPNIPGYLKLYM